MRFSHHNLSQNPEDIPTAIRERLVSPERIEFLGNGIDLQEFRPARLRPEERDAKRRELGLGPEHVVVGMVARVVREKGYVEALQAARNLRPRFPKARYLFVGDFDGDKPDALSRSILDEFGLSTEVSFLGHRTDVSDLYAAMDVFILPSYREGFPRAPMEAAASGIPAIVTDTRGCRETVVHDVTGYLVPVADADALGDSLARLLADPELRARFGAAARQKAIAEFDEQIVFQRVLRTYSRLVERKLRGRARDAAS
jgi:glycosyltransferase involved in cell wall biosynthesis